MRGPAKPRLGPGYQPAERVLRIFNNPVGLQLLTHFDPYFWRNKIKAHYLVTLGTNDEFYALGAANSMLTEMSGDKAFLAIDNEKHGWVSMKQLAAWRMWLAHTFLSRPIAKIDAKGVVAADQLVVSARINTATPPVAVRLFYSYNKATDDWREARWQSVAMSNAEGTYTARLPMNMGQKLGYYVKVEDMGPGGTGLVSSLVEVAE